MSKQTKKRAIGSVATSSGARQPKRSNGTTEQHEELLVSNPRAVRVMTMRSKKPDSFMEKHYVVNTTSNSKEEWSRGLSPFFLGPVAIPAAPGEEPVVAKVMENAWQYSKVYPEHSDITKKGPAESWFKWSRAGFGRSDPVRFPMGRGRVPLGSWIKGELKGYIDSRALLYAPLYAEAVVKTPAFARLREIYDKAISEGRVLFLLDHDGWDHVAQGFSLRDVLMAPKPKMGHAFVLAGLLEGNHFWLKPAPGEGISASIHNTPTTEPAKRRRALDSDN